MGELPHVLVVDDDDRLRDLLRRFLCDHGFLVSVARNGAEARAQLAGLAFDLMVLDVMMPGEDGRALIADLRARGLSVPVLMLTALGETDDRIAGLEAGVDDYLTKPFEPRELVLRLHAILRRAQSAPTAGPETALSLGRFRFDPVRAELTENGARVHLTTGEVALLSALAARPGEAVARDQLSEEGESGGARAVDVQVTRLRRKIEDDPRRPRYLLTVRGRGYRLVPD